MPADVAVLPGQDTVLSSWRALAGTEFGPGQLIETPHAMAAVFPEFGYLNNAILTAETDCADSAAAALGDVYGAAGITTWALWVPGRATTFDESSDALPGVGTLRRDVTTVAMQRTLDGDLRKDGRVTTVSGAALRRLVVDEAVPVEQLGVPDPNARITGWALVTDGQAITTAYTHCNGLDCGIYAVGTLASWRRRGYARTLVEHILADARENGMQTATLQSTPMGRALYDSLGFRAVGRYEEWLQG